MDVKHEESPTPTAEQENHVDVKYEELLYESSERERKETESSKNTGLELDHEWEAQLMRCHGFPCNPSTFQGYQV